MFNRLLVDGFRRLTNADLALRPLCVLVGANGAGKTSLLDVFSLFAASAHGALRERVSRFGGLQTLLTAGGPEQLTLGLSMDEAGHSPLEYSLQIAPSGASYTIESESLTQRRREQPPPFKHIDSRGTDIRYFNLEENRIVRPTWEHNPLETSLAQVPRLFREPEDFRLRLASSTFYHALNVEPRSAVRQPQPMHPADLPGREGEDLISCLYYMRETDPPRFSAVEDTLRAAFPNFERLEFPPVAAGTLAMCWREKNFATSFYTHQLSEGTLRFLWLTALLQSPGLTAMTLIDEPEVSLHPELLSLFADLMREASSRTQLVVATHSDCLVRFLRPEEVVVVDVDDIGHARLTWADQLDLDRWLDEYTLGEVWRMGRMGGRP
jgi:predicted ATPase